MTMLNQVGQISARREGSGEIVGTGGGEGGKEGREYNATNVVCCSEKEAGSSLARSSTFDTGIYP